MNGGSSDMRAMRPASTDQDGFALVTAILVLVLVAALLAVLSFVMLSSVDQSNESARDTRSVAWLQAASEDLAGRLVNFDIGAKVSTVPTTMSGYRILTVPTSGIPGATYLPSLQAFQITVNVGGINQTGYYRVMPPLPGMSAGNVAAEYVGRAGVPDRNQGVVTMILRGWLAQGSETRARDVKVTFRRGSLSRFAVLSEDQIDLAGLGSLAVTGSVHSNNIRWSPSNPIPGVSVSGVSLTNAQRISTTNGPIAGSCPSSKCFANTQKPVSFTTVDVAQNQVARLSGMGKCVSSGFAACSISHYVGTNNATNNRIPGYLVDIGGAGGSVTVQSLEFAVRADVPGQPRLDDHQKPFMTGGYMTTLTPGSGGGALLLDADVVVRGARAANAPPVTIMVRRSANAGTVTFLGTPGWHVTDPASLYLSQTTAGFTGSSSSSNPVGLVAEGGVYVPSWGLQPVSASGDASARNLWLRNVAVMAKSSEFSLGPSILAIAADRALPSGDLQDGGGINPCGIDAITGLSAATSYGQGALFRFDGAFATNRPPVFRYGSACYLGYAQRQFTYVPDLTWNPPPFYPADSPWHLADWTEYSNG